MNSLRKLVGFLMVLTFAALALPASAQSGKNFKITVPSSVSLGTQSVQFTFTNAGSSSNFNSIEIDVQSGLLTINPTGASLSGGNGTFVWIDSKRAQFVGISPSVKKSITATISVNATANNCSTSTVEWFAHAWTGSPSSPSQTFTLVDSSGNLISETTGPFPSSTIAAPNCTLGFINQPSSALVNTLITSVPYDVNGAKVKVGLFNGAALDTTFTGSVALALNGGSGLTSDSEVAVAGVAEFDPLKISTAGTNLTLTATSGSYSGTSSAFWITTDSGTIGCTSLDNYASNDGEVDPDLTYVNLAPGAADPRDFGIRRGPNLEPDGNGNYCPSKVGVKMTVNANNTAEFIYDKSSGQLGTFKYTVVWSEVDVDGSGLTTGWTQRRPEVAWYNGLYVPALNCADDELSLGTALLPTIPAVEPFTDYTAPHPYAPGQLAKVCVAAAGFVSNGRDIDTNIIKIIYWHKFVDEADALMRLP